MLDSAMMNFTSMRTPSPLTRQEQAHLAVLAKAGDGNALAVLIETNLNLAVKIALQHHRQLPRHTMSPYDLIHTAVLAMPKAIGPFDPTKNVPFGSYAAFFMRRDILDYIHEQGIVYVPKRNDGKTASVSYCYLDAGTDDFYVPELGSRPEQLDVENGLDIAAALGKLPLVQRRALEQHLGLVDGIEMSFCAMGEAAGTSRGPHIAQYNKALEMLRSFFGVESLPKQKPRCKLKRNERGCEVKHARHKTDQSAETVTS